MLHVLKTGGYFQEVLECIERWIVSVYQLAMAIIVSIYLHHEGLGFTAGLGGCPSPPPSPTVPPAPPPPLPLPPPPPPSSFFSPPKSFLAASSSSLVVQTFSTNSY